MDNHQQILPKKSISEGKSAITQVGTAMILKQDRPYHLPPGTRMRSPRGVSLVVLVCLEHTEYQLKIAGCLPLDYITGLAEDGAVQTDLHIYDQRRILEGFLYPEISWEIENVPGLSKMLKVTYLRQEVPPPKEP